MGTRALVIMRVKTRNGKYQICCVMYQQFDGHIKGVGIKLINFLHKIKLVRSLHTNDKDVAYGAGCLFSQIIVHFKTAAGKSYIIEPYETAQEEYNYYVDIDNEKLLVNISIKNYEELIFSGTLEEAHEFVNNYSIKISNQNNIDEKNHT